jgi:hypothetical protein
MATREEPTAIEMLVAGGPVFFDLCEARTHKELLHKVNTAIRRDNGVALMLALHFAVAKQQSDRVLEGTGKPTELSVIYDEGPGAKEPPA